MARPLTLNVDGEEFFVNIRKVDRDDLYGTVEIEAFDEKDDPAEIKVLAADGNTLIDKGGTALETLDKSGNSLERRQISAVSKEGDKIEPVPSSFDGINKVSVAEVEDYLSLIVKSVYVLSPAGEGDIKGLCDRLSDGRIYSFPFSYRSSLENDEAYLIGNDTDVFMVIGTQATLQYLKLNQAAVLESTEEEEISADDLTFDF